jgi:hypothetical protein
MAVKIVISPEAETDLAEAMRGTSSSVPVWEKSS